MTPTRTAARVAAWIALAAASTAAVPSAQAADGGSPLKWSLGGGFTSGGDNLVAGSLADGSTPQMKAGRGLQVFAGAEYWVTQPLAVQANVGFQLDRRKAGDGQLLFQRFPVEGMGLYAITNNLRFGAGVQTVFGARLRGTGEAAPLARAFKRDTGLVLEGEFLITPHTAVKLRHVKHRFDADDGRAQVEGRQVAVLFSYYF